MATQSRGMSTALHFYMDLVIVIRWVYFASNSVVYMQATFANILRNSAASWSSFLCGHVQGILGFHVCLLGDNLPLFESERQRVGEVNSSKRLYRLWL